MSTHAYKTHYSFTSKVCTLELKCLILQALTAILSPCACTWRAHIHQFLSVSRSVCNCPVDQNSDWTKSHRTNLVKSGFTASFKWIIIHYSIVHLLYFCVWNLHMLKALKTYLCNFRGSIEANWSLYKLSQPKPVEIYKDIVSNLLSTYQILSGFRPSAPDTSPLPGPREISLARWSYFNPSCTLIV